jgi:hypothetical protein
VKRRPLFVVAETVGFASERLHRRRRLGDEIMPEAEPAPIVPAPGRAIAPSRRKSTVADG